MKHLRRYLTALATLSLLCGAYWAVAAPWLAPPKLKGPQKSAASAPPVSISAHVQEELTRLFPPGAWELDPATKVLETDRCTLLIKDYLPTPDGRLKLNPCTLIFYSSGLAARDESAAGRRRPIVLQAPSGAELEFDKAIDPLKVTFGRLVGGHLNGEITISSPPSQSGSRDALLLKTRSVSLDRRVIKTFAPVEFRYGDSEGRGQELEIELLQPQAGPDGKKTRAPLGGMKSLVLRKLEYVRIATEGQGLLGDTLSGKPQAGGAAPLEIKCQGWFVFDVIGQVARFEKEVEVLRLLPGSPPDKLLCDELLLTFLVRAEGAAAAAAANKSDPLAGRLQRIVALGAPAVLEAPASGVSAKAAWMEYEMGKRRITLRPDGPQTRPQRVTQVSLRQHEQHFTARELQYEMAEGKRLGTMWAAGPGEIKLLQGRGRSQQLVTARWEKELWVRPQDQCQVISLISAASVIAEPLGRFDADELHLWVREVPAEKKPDTTPSNANHTGNKPRTTLLPDRLLAKGHVSLISPQLDAQSGELQIWFKHLPPDADEPAEQMLPNPAGPLREPVARATFQQGGLPGAIPPSGAIRNIIRPPNLQKFRVTGDKIQMQLAVRGREFDLEDLAIERQVMIDETRTPEPGQEPIHVAGDLLNLRHGTSPEAKIEVSGQPAEVAGRGMSLVAGMIHVHRGENRMWIEGPGEATLPAPAEMPLALPVGNTSPRRAGEGVPEAAKPAQKLHLVWQQGLDFDGSVVRISGDVQARTKTQTASSQLLEATLNKRLDFLAAKGGERPELAKIQLSGQGGVYLTNRGLNEQQEQVSFEQAQFPALTIDIAAGTLHAPGPGWVSTVRRSAGLPGLPAAAANNSPPPPIQPPGGPALPVSQQPLASVHISFERALVGEIARRQIEFQGSVRTTYSPASDFSDRIIVINVADLTERAVLMTSDRLTVTEMITPVQRWIEMQATGRTIMQGRTFNVNTPGRLSYTSATEYVTIEGDGRANAEINYQSAPGEPFNPVSVQKARYNIRTGEFDGEIKRLEFFIPGNAKLPATGNRGSR